MFIFPQKISTPPPISRGGGRGFNQLYTGIYWLVPFDATTKIFIHTWTPIFQSPPFSLRHVGQFLGSFARPLPHMEQNPFGGVRDEGCTSDSSGGGQMTEMGVQINFGEHEALQPASDLPREAV